jgi:hypothetical protein
MLMVMLMMAMMSRVAEKMLLNETHCGGDNVLVKDVLDCGNGKW